jgi:hypothetical protein
VVGVFVELDVESELLDWLKGEREGGTGERGGSWSDEEESVDFWASNGCRGWRRFSWEYSESVRGIRKQRTVPSGGEVVEVKRGINRNNHTTGRARLRLSWVDVHRWCFWWGTGVV